MRSVRLLILAAVTMLAGAAPAAAHHPSSAAGGGYQWADRTVSHETAATATAPASRFEPGPCTEAAADSMPVDEGHDHLATDQHAFGCRVVQSAFLSLKEQLKARPDVTLGEMDIKRDIAAVAVAYPEAGFLLFDVADPAQPKFLSWYRGDECEGLLIDVDCGAFVDVSPDGKRVYISVQQISVVPGALPSPRPAAVAYPGVDVVDISDRRSPRLIQKYPVVSVGGVHTTRSFDVPGKGEYTVSVANGRGAHIAKVTDAGQLEPVTTIRMDELHDTFLQQDPISGQTLMYVAGGFDTGFMVYDLSDPANAKGLAEWDLTPECDEDWYSHTIDVAVRNGRRFVTMPAEAFDSFGKQGKEDDPLTEHDDDDQGQGCGTFVGNGDLAGPMWIVDATDFSKLGTLDARDSEAEEEASDMKARSEDALVATWSNAAGRAAGNLTFSPHNQQIVGDRIYLSGYHSGVTVLDASAAFRGEHVRPKELGVYVPHGAETRPIAEPITGDALLIPFFTEFLPFRPNVWDMQWHKGHILAADMVGGFYSLRYEGEDGAPAAAAADRPSDGARGGRPAHPAAGEPAAGQPPAPAATAAPARAASSRAGRRSQRCKARRTRITVRDPRGRERIRSIRVRIDGRRSKVVAGRRLARMKRGSRFRVPLTLRPTRSGRARVQVVARTSRGRTLRLSRTYRTCTMRRA
jgi:hypothetical protein